MAKTAKQIAKDMREQARVGRNLCKELDKCADMLDPKSPNKNKIPNANETVKAS